VRCPSEPHPVVNFFRSAIESSVASAARRRSGSLITVRHALNQGREVWVVPGASEGPFAEGSNRLLREGARAIRNAADVVEDLTGMHASQPGVSTAAGRDEITDATVATNLAQSGESARSPEDEPAPDSSVDSIEQRILAELGAGAATRADLIVRVELDPGRLAQALLDLELAGRIVEERDGRFHMCWG